MILLFIYQTYNSQKLDKKNQSILKDILKFKKSTQLLRNSKSVLLLVQMYC